MKLWQALWQVFLREFIITMRRSTEVLTPLVFFIIVVSLFPLGVGPEAALLRTTAPGILWVAALLAAMLSLARMFGPDFADGTLEQMALAPHPLSLLALAKVSAHWVLSGLPLTLLSPLLAIQLGLPAQALGPLFWSLLLGTPVLTLIGAIAAALTLGVRGGGVLVSLLVLPLYTPVLIFGAQAVSGGAVGRSPAAEFGLLGAFLTFAVSLAPWAIAAALRVSLD
ncbi:MAG TPA: heme exporter protein CcmB [Acidiferrobacteraceae bacterium]|nr:heme exporter protein CcmB [Acidiferrobacteraceae bacterium]